MRTGSPTWRAVLGDARQRRGAVGVEQDVPWRLTARLAWAGESAGGAVRRWPAAAGAATVGQVVRRGQAAGAATVGPVAPERLAAVGVAG